MIAMKKCFYIYYTQYTYNLFPYNASVSANIYIHLLCRTNQEYDFDSSKTTNS